MWQQLRPPPSSEAALYDAKCIQAALDAAHGYCHSQGSMAKVAAARLVEEESDPLKRQQLSTQLENSAASCYTLLCSLERRTDEKDKRLMKAVQDATAWQVIEQMTTGGDLDTAMGRTLFAAIEDITRSQLKHSCLKKLRHLSAIGWFLQSLCGHSHNDFRPKRRKKKARAKGETAQTDNVAVFNESPETSQDLSEGCNVEDVEDAHLDSVSVKCMEAALEAPNDTQSNPPKHAEQSSRASHHGEIDVSSNVTASALWYPEVRRASATLAISEAPGLRLAMTACARHPWEVILDEAYAELRDSLSEACECGRVGRSFVHRRLFESVPRWRVKFGYDESSQNEWRPSSDGDRSMIAQWIRNDSDQLQRRTLLILVLFGTAHVLPLIEKTGDDSLSRAVYGALQDFSSIYGLSDGDAQAVLSAILAQCPRTMNPDVYVAYMAVLGRLLRGTAAADCWAHAMGHQNQSLIACAITQIIEIAGWWHRNRFHEENTAKVLGQAFASLLQIFDACDSLDRWERDICRLARWCIYNYHHISTALDSAKSLLHMGGSTSQF
jgi:hypothetical protein